MYHDSPRSTGSAGVVIPIRAFAFGKARLASVLDPATRIALARSWAERVVEAAHTSGLVTVVVSSDDDVREWATALRLAVVDDPGSLDAAAAAGCAALREAGCTRLVVSHADLPHAHTFAPVVRDGAQPVVVLVPCHRDDGTPVMSLPATAEFEFCYGPDSFRKHAAEARRRGLAVRVVRDPSLAFDVDVPADLAKVEGELHGTAPP
jgi:2-phospho-L-lactate guanylyltransferase